jgi:hypothetical protein
MKRSLKKSLPGGPNEKVFSREGYRSTSPDVNNPFNIIPSGNITMKEKDGTPLKKGPLLGIDNLGNSQLMLPGANYQFPGDVVKEVPLAKKGGQFQNSNIYATNKLFAKNPLFKKRKKGKKAKGIYNPKAKYTYQPGGEIEYNQLPERYKYALQNFIYPNVSTEPNDYEENENGELVPVIRPGYNPTNNTITYDPNNPVENINNDWWREHELFHQLQNLAGGENTSDAGMLLQKPNPYVASNDSMGAYYNRRDSDVEKTIDNMIAQNPNLKFIPREKLAQSTYEEGMERPGFIGAEDLQYADPSTLEGEARQYEQYIEEGNPSIFSKKQFGGPKGQCPLGYIWNGIECIPNPFETRPSQRAAVYMDKDGTYKMDPVYQQYSQQKFDVAQSNKKAQDFNKMYAQSKNYKRLLKKQGYTPEEIEDRINSIMNINDIRYTDEGPSWVGTNEDTGNEFISYNVTDPGDWPGFDQIAAHEWGHVGVDSGANPLKQREREEFINRINKEQAGVTGNPDDLVHDMEPQENRADLLQLRQQLQEAGVFDSTKRKKFTKKDLDKYRKLMESSKRNWDNMWNRMFRLYDDDSIIYFMNNVAKNNSNEDLQVAKYGLELDLTEDEIQKYVKGGYVVEDISVPSLTRMDKGGGPNTCPPDHYWNGEACVPTGRTFTPIDPNYVAQHPDEASFIQNEAEVSVSRPASDIAKFRDEWKRNNPRDQWLDEKKRYYLNTLSNKALDKLAGVNMSYFPSNVRQNYLDEYEYLANTYAIEKIGDKRGFNPKRRGEWVDQLSEGEKNAMAESKYSSKLQPSYWARSRAGVQELGNFVLKNNPISALIGVDEDLLHFNIPGLTKKEQKEIAESPFGGLESLSFLDMQGAWLANHLNNRGLSTGSDYKELPGILSAEKMANVDDDEAMLYNILTYAGLEAIPKLGLNAVRGLGKGAGSLARGTRNLIKHGNIGKVGNYKNVLAKGLDIHDVRLKYHNNMILDLDESDMLNKFGKGNKKNYERAIVEDVAGKMHTDDVEISEDFSTRDYIDDIMGKEQPKVEIPDKSPKVFEIDEGRNPNMLEQEENIINPNKGKFELTSFYSPPYERTSTSRAADKWLEDWFYNPEIKQKFMDYGGTESEWQDVLNSLENPIKSNYVWGKNQPGGIYMKVFDQASIPLDATVDIGVHEGVHKTKLLLDKRDPILHKLWNDFTDAVKLTPTEAYPEIFRFRQKLGLRPGQKINLKTMEDNLHLINDGYGLPFKIKNKYKLLDIINTAPIVVPGAVIMGAAAYGANDGANYKSGGLIETNDDSIVSELTKKEIDKLIKQGYIIEEID